MEIHRFEVIVEHDPKQYAVFDRLDSRVVVRYASKKKADAVCKDLNDNIKE